MIGKIEPHQRAADVAQGDRLLGDSVYDYGAWQKDLQIGIGRSEIARIAGNRGHRTWLRGLRTAERAENRGRGRIDADIVDQLVSCRGIDKKLNAQGFALVEQMRLRHGGQRKKGPCEVDRESPAKARGEFDGSVAQFADRGQIGALILPFESSS